MLCATCTRGGSLTVDTPDTTLDGEVAFVGGASRNLGGLIGAPLGAEGARVAVHHNSDSSRAEAEAEDVVEDGAARIRPAAEQPEGLRGVILRIADVPPRPCPARSPTAPPVRDSLV
ncbi:hypothetical protein [Streptomyces sp. NPDC021356]|uniref:hypothetical protein n=1 Tax=Streptomyces sp. NPDC021356 TaxID=3154900 RepID=UPI0033F170D2